MLVFAKIINEETKECCVGTGTDEQYYASLGMEKMEVEHAWNGAWYLQGFVPEKPAPTYEEIDALRIAYRHEHIDDFTLRRMRKQANGTWTEEAEQEYLALDAEVTAYIEEHYPYPVEEEESDAE